MAPIIVFGPKILQLAPYASVLSNLLKLHSRHTWPDTLQPFGTPAGTFASMEACKEPVPP